VSEPKLSQDKEENRRDERRRRDNDRMRGKIGNVGVADLKSEHEKGD
jgi:hypothetical protein